MTEVRVSPLRQRMIEDMNIRGTGEKTQKAHIRNVKHFAAFLGRSPDTATPEELRSYQLKMTRDGVSVSTYNIRIISLRFFFGVTCGREEMKRFMQFHRKPRKLPVVLSVEEVADVLAAVPGPGLKSIELPSASATAQDYAPPRCATSRSRTSTAAVC